MLGLIAVLSPKFGRWAVIHRWAGRSYGLAMLISTALSIPLAVTSDSPVLLTVGVLTFVALVVGWWALRRYRSESTSRAQRQTLLRTHVVAMGSSYIAAWTAFLLTNGPIPGAEPWHRWVYIVVPTLVGSVIIRAAARRYAPRRRPTFAQAETA